MEKSISQIVKQIAENIDGMIAKIEETQELLKQLPSTTQVNSNIGLATGSKQALEHMKRNTIQMIF